MSTTLTYDITIREGDDLSVTVFANGESYIATPEHPNFKAIIDKLMAGEDIGEDQASYNSALIDLFDVSIGIINKLDKLSDRVSAAAGHLFIDGDRVDGALADTIVRYLAEKNDDWKPLVNFLEKLYTNTTDHTRENLFRWLRQRSFGICPDGDFIAYKSVNGSDEMFRSVSSGTAYVNGVRYVGQIPTEIGSVVEMPRSKVTFDPGVACSTGLHAGTWDYASTFSGNTVLRVKINPRDVVSVPTDAYDAKVRVCRYYIESVANGKQDEGLLYVPKDSERLARAVQRPADEATVVDPDTVAEKPARVRGARKGGAGKAAKRPAPKALEFPKHYEDFQKKHFDGTSLVELRWLAKEWDVKPTTGNKAGYVDALTKVARKRRKEIDG